jgi:cell division septation protein DedD
MSTNQKLNNTTESDTGNKAGDKQSKAKGLDLSATQIVGGALAAMTAAALGSRLSVAGTIVGAALASIIAAVAGSLYTASLRHTRDKVKTVFWTGNPNEVEEPTVMEIVEDREGHVAGQRSHLVAPESIDTSPVRRKLNWKRVLVVALAAFGIAAVSLTAFELATGNALSGGEGTTIQQVRERNAGTESDTENKSDTDNKKESPSEDPTKQPTTAASEAAPTDEPRQAPTSEPTETTTAPTPQAEATTTAPETTPSSNR